MADLNDIVARVSDWLISQAMPPSEPTIKRALSELKVVLAAHERVHVENVVSSELIGYGLLSGLFGPGVTDILINGHEQVWVDDGNGLRLSGVTFADDDAVRRLAVRLALSAGKRLDESQPYLDARLPDGVRLHAVLSPVAVAGTAISLRIPSLNPLSVDTWCVADPALRTHLDRIIDTGATYVISGATGSGKTSLLRAMLSLSPQRRIVTVEDTYELQLDTRNVVALQTRGSNTEGAGEISMRELVKQSMRMRPDIIVVGEVRGAEVLDWLLAVSSGHPGSATTVHAHSATEAIQRLHLLCSLAEVSQTVAQEVLRSAVDFVIHTVRVENTRQVEEIRALK